MTKLKEKITKWETDTLDKIRKSYETRERKSAIFNNIPYSTVYEDNYRRAIGFAPPKKEGGSSAITMGMIPDKVSHFVSLLKNITFHKKFKINGKDGKEVEGIGEFYDLMVDHTLKLEKFEKAVWPLVLFEVIAQGDAFVLENFEVKNDKKQTAIDENGKEINLNQLDFTLEAFEKIKYKQEEEQIREAKTKLLDGRCVILGDITKENIQDQPFVAIELVVSKTTTDKMFGSLEKYKKLNESLEAGTFEEIVTEKYNNNFLLYTGNKNERWDKDTQVLIHRYYDKENDLFNIFVNGVAMLPIETPLSIFFPSKNYPISQVTSERVPHSAYSRSIPSKIKWSSDYLDWQLRVLTEKFEKSNNPPLLIKSPFLIKNDFLGAGKRTLNVTNEMYTKADPGFPGITRDDITFTQMIKELLEQNSLNKTTSGELSGNNTATEIGLTDKYQNIKLAPLIEGVVDGYCDINMRRAETVESRYTQAMKTTTVDDKEVPIFQNFTVNANGSSHIIEFVDWLEGMDKDEYEIKRNELLKQELDSKKQGKTVTLHFFDPKYIRDGSYDKFIEAKWEKKKDSILDHQMLQNEIVFLKNTFGNINDSVLQKEYIEATNRSEDLFLPPELVQQQEQAQAQAQVPQAQKQATTPADMRLKIPR